MDYVTRTATTGINGSRAYTEESGNPPLVRVMFEGRILGTFGVKQRGVARVYADAFNAGLKEGRRV